MDSLYSQQDTTSFHPSNCNDTRRLVDEALKHIEVVVDQQVELAKNKIEESLLNAESQLAARANQQEQTLGQIIDRRYN
jgi:hypothetical protein